MADYHYDVVIICAGPSAEGAALNAAKKGKKVAVIEDKKNGRWQLHPLGYDSLKGVTSCREADHPIQYQPDVP